MASHEDLYDDEFEEIIISFVPTETVAAICNGTHSALEFIHNKELLKIKLAKTTEEMISICKPMWENAIDQLKEDKLNWSATIN